MTRPLRFCMVTTFYPPHHFGGDAIFVYRLSELLARAGHSVDVVYSVDAFRACGGHVVSDPLPHHPNVRVIPLERSAPRAAALAVHQTGTPAFYGRQLRTLLDDGGYDVINYHNISLIGGPGVLRYGRAIKLYTTHDYWLVCPTHILLKYDREACDEQACLSCTLAHKRPPQLWRAGPWLARCAAHVDRFIFPSQFTSDRHIWGGLTLPGVVLPHFVHAPADTIGVTGRSGSPYFLFVGRLERLKGLQDALPAFSGPEGPELRIAGSGTYEEELRRLAQGMPRVRFLGYVEPADLGPLYRSALATLVPSLCYELGPLSAMESMSAGTPVIARDIGGFPDALRATDGGLLFRTRAELLAAVDRLTHDSELRERLGRNAASGAKRLWNPEGYLATYLELIETIDISRRSSTASGNGAHP
jgi:glycosyltransferase involved in cell wall biosynthesis